MPSTNKVRTEANANRKSIPDFFPTEKLTDFYNATEKQLSGIYLKIVKSNIDVLQTSSEFTDVTSLKGLFEAYKATNKRDWFMSSIIAMQTINETIPNAVVYQAIDLLEIPKSTKSDLRKKHKEEMQKATFARMRLNNESNELRIEKQLEYNEKFIFAMGG
jgi:hypothetical protein